MEKQGLDSGGGIIEQLVRSLEILFLCSPRSQARTGESTPFRKLMLSSNEIIQLFYLNQNKFALSFNLVTHSFSFSFPVTFHMS